MRPIHPGRWLAALSLVAVLIVFLVDSNRTQPTPISAVHAAVAELDGGNACDTCHGSSNADLARACLECHGPIAQDIEGERGLHGSVVEGASKRCGECHQEHAGRRFPLVSEQSFALAGFPRREDFDHPWESYLLDGAHLDLQCSECHESADVELLVEGEERFHGLSQDCIACHEDGDHGGEMERACERCHGQDAPFKELAAFEHDERFALDGQHADLECSACHEHGGTHSVERGASSPELPEVRLCRACHEAPHSKPFFDGLAAFFEEPAAAACTRCHGLGRSPWSTADTEITAEVHAASGFALHVPHDGLECSECHGVGETWQERFPGRSEESCEACHEDPHHAQFDTANGPRACRECHAVERFVPGSFDLQEHAGTSFPLLESHQAVACSACHEALESEGPDRQWANVNTSCRACHEDAHAGFFEQVALRAGREAPADCSVCHGQVAFAAQSTEDEFDHLRWAAYALEAAHAEAACVACHANGELDATGRRFGRVAANYSALPTEMAPCSGCHLDPHEVDFDGPGKPGRVGSRAGCARCHDLTSFSAGAADFDHATWTARRLQGAHFAVACERCHPRSSLPDDAGRSFGRPREVFGPALDECVTCHADPHRGVFDDTPPGAQVGEREGCARCHGEESFRSNFTLEFDHDAWTGNKLRSAHGDPACVTCHPPLGVFADGARSTRPAAGSSCAACHRDPHAGQFNAQPAAACEACHEDQLSWSQLVFDHDTDSTYALDATHAALDCALCHPSSRTAGGLLVTRYKPLGSACADCHSAGGEDPR